MTFYTRREKHPKVKLQRLRKIRIWTFESLVHQINSFSEVLKLKQIFQKNKVVTGKTPLFVRGPFCSRNSICLNTLASDRAVLNGNVLNLTWFQLKKGTPGFQKRFSFSRKSELKLMY